MVLSSGSISLSWDLPLVKERNGAIIGYVIHVTNLDNAVVTQYSTHLVFNATISNLEPFTMYEIIIAARTAIDVGPFSSAVTERTMEDGMNCY